ncbi:hypothetical protein PYCC9005_004279 [Savitreella phatthalungensis]
MLLRTLLMNIVLLVASAQAKGLLARLWPGKQTEGRPEIWINKLFDNEPFEPPPLDEIAMATPCSSESATRPLVIYTAVKAPGPTPLPTATLKHKGIHRTADYDRVRGYRAQEAYRHCVEEDSGCSPSGRSTPAGDNRPAAPRPGATPSLARSTAALEHQSPTRQRAASSAARATVPSTQHKNMPIRHTVLK